MTSPLRFGILGAARIAPKALVQPLGKVDSAVVTRVAARSPERAAAFAAEHDIPEVSESYDALLAADDVDVVYNPLPMNLHAEWTIKALRAGKHVLCEKPFASNAAEAEEMVRVANETGLVLGEAFHHRYHPMFVRILELVAAGTIGELTRIDAAFNITIRKPDIRWNYDTSGGSLMDLGCYPLIWTRHVIQAAHPGAEPTVVSAEAVEEPDKIDSSIWAELSFPSGATARVESSMTTPSSDASVGLSITGTNGSIATTNAIAPHDGHVLTVRTEGGETSGEIPGGTTYEHMCRAFCDHLVHGTEFPTMATDSIANMAAIDSIYTAAGLPIRGM